MLFIGLTVSAEEIIKDRKILKREAFLNLSKGGYLISKVTIMFVLSAIQTICLVLVGNSILELHGMTADYWMVLFSAACFANMLGLNISSAFNSAVTIYILIPFILIPQLLFSGVMVKFDKLNPAIIVYNSVPVIGELMVTRWAYEAMSVNQYKTNNYEKHFYKYDKEKSIADFKKNYWIPALKTKIEDCIKNYNDPDKKEQLTNDLKLLTEELSVGGITVGGSGIFSKSNLDSLNISSFNIETGKQLRNYLESLYQYYIGRYNSISKTKNLLISKMNDTEEKRKLFLKVKDAYENEALTDLVVNKSEVDHIIEVNNELVQQADPIYLDPVKSGNVRAHFFAPRKKLLGNLYDTYWINIMIIWLMSLFLAITLYFDLFRKFIDSTGNLFGNIGKIFSFSKNSARG